MTKTVTALHCADASVFVEFEGDCAHCEIERLHAEVEGAHHDITSLMDACNAEVNEVERLRKECAGWKEALDLEVHEVTRMRAALTQIQSYTLILSDSTALVCGQLAKIALGSAVEPSGEHDQG